MVQYEIAPDRRPVVCLPGGLALRASVEPDGPLIDNFFAEYDRAFVLPNEKEQLEGFRACLALNLPPAYAPLAKRHGPFREFVALAVETGTADETVVGGANFICYPLHADATGPVLAMHLNYIFVRPEQRRRGHLGQLLDGCSQLARNAFYPPGDAPPTERLPLIIFMELNDPLRLDQAAYARDTSHSGVDQFQRIGIWAGAGARIIDFPYVQPALSPAQAADRTLLLAVLGATGTELSACLVRDHLAIFFAISVLKGADLRHNLDVQAQLNRIDHLCRGGTRLALLDPRPYLADRDAQSRASAAEEAISDLRDALRRHCLR